MRTVYALFVGIDEYPQAPLGGCVNDVRDAETWLRGHGGPACEIRALHDEQATRAAVLAGIEDHLGRSGPGDTALLWFSGHGSERLTDDPREATGRAQALVCHDSLSVGGQALLQDTELGPLLDGIAARGAHVVAVLDCCHSGGATRGDAPEVPDAAPRGVDWRPWWRPEAPRGVRDGAGPGPGPGRHVLLAACRPQERAYEGRLDGRRRGFFSDAMLRALDRLGPAATYGTLHALVEERVRSLSPLQHAELRGPENGRFLSGDSVPASPFLLRHTTSGWEVNCGAVHGLRAPGGEFTVLTLLGEGTPRAVVVREVRPESALVDPVGWQPGSQERELVYGLTPSALAFPPAAVKVVGLPDAVRLVERAVADVPALSSGDGGDRGALPLRVEVRDGWAWVSGGAGHPLPPLPLRSSADAVRVADCLAHIARWHRMRDLVNPDAWLSSLVRVTVEATTVGDVRYTPTGKTVCTYTPDGREPQVMVRIRNDSDRQLWCVLLDLTDSYASSPSLYEGDFVAPGRAGLARRGEPVWLRLPPGRAVVRGAFTVDWLKVIVAENELNIAPFRLPAWSPDAPTAARDDDSGSGDRGGLLRLTAPSAGRDAGGPAYGVGRWGTAQVVVRTEVP